MKRGDKMNAPKLRFKEFNDEWISYKFYDLVSIINGQVDPNKKEYCNLPHIGPGNIEKETGRLLEYNLAKDDKLISSKYLFNEKSVIYGKINPHFAKVCYPKFVGLCSADAYPINPIEEKLTSTFLLYLLLNPKFTKFATSVSMRTGMPKINRDELGIYKFIIPKINEQIKIGKTLELLDKKIELQTKKIEDLKLFKLYMENQFIFKDDASYIEYKLRDILIEGNKTPVADTSKYQKLTIKLNLKGLEFNESQKEMSDKRPFYVRDENELIIGKQNYFNGSIAIVNKKYAGGICSNAIMSFKAKDGFDIKYIYLYLSQKSYMKQREFLANGTGQKELSEKEFLNFSIRIPTDNKVKKIIKNVNCISKKILLEENKLNKLIELKKGLMQNMFV